MNNVHEIVFDNEDQFPAPEDLGPAGAELWRSITETFDMADEPGKLKILHSACRTTDVIRTLDEAAAESPLVVKGSTGQPVANPLITESRQQTSLLNTLIKALALPESDAEAADRAARRSRAGRTGANARHGKGNR